MRLSALNAPVKHLSARGLFINEASAEVLSKIRSSALRLLRHARVLPLPGYICKFIGRHFLFYSEALLQLDSLRLAASLEHAVTVCQSCKVLMKCSSKLMCFFLQNH